MRKLIWIGITILWISGGSLGAERITFKNGDRLTVTVLRLNERYALVTSPLGDFRIQRDQIQRIENTKALPMQVRLKNGEKYVYQFLSADERVIRFSSSEKVHAIAWSDIDDCIFLEP